MSFRVTARVLLQLGSELISTDFIAIYELIKNAVDAKSKKVTIEVLVRVPHERWRGLADRIMEECDAHVGGSDAKAQESAILALRTRLVAAIDSTAPMADVLQDNINSAETLGTLSRAWDDANSLTVSDTGDGMSASLLQNVYLTIGTPYRLEQRKNARERSRAILGEKGLGRLSSMRLGKRLHLETGRSVDSHWNVLDIDWAAFERTSGDPDNPVLVESIEFRPTLGAKKADPTASGTSIRISALTSAWERQKFEDLAREKLSKLSDPFSHGVRYPIKLIHNGEVVAVPSFSKILLDHAHASIEARLEYQEDPDSYPRLSGRIVYKNREKSFGLTNEHLASVVLNLPPGAPVPPGMPAGLRTLGPFEMCAFWFNRRIMQAVEGIGERKEVMRLVTGWSGGLMLYRDGFRVMPYAEGPDDWLDMDRKAFGSGGYKVHRAQIIGRAAISSAGNPSLMDQTNREGLRHSSEKDVLVVLMKHILETELRVFLTQVDEDLAAQEPIEPDELASRVELEEQSIRSNITLLVRKHPELKSDREIVDAIRHAADQIHESMRQINEMVAGYEEGRSQLLHLAGLGLMVEVLAHEINRAITHTLSTLAERGIVMTREAIEAVFKNLEEQLKTLQKRLRILDPLTTAGRQIKESFDVGALILDTFAAHEGQFARHRICPSLRIEPNSGRLQVRAVKGMFVQVLENLISNSVYWLTQKAIRDPSFVPEIVIVLDIRARTLAFSDNGPGIDPTRSEDVFQAFYTTKPPGRGKGLGLFIAREIAQYHAAKLFLSDVAFPQQQTLNTFVLDLAEVKS